MEPIAYVGIGVGGFIALLILLWVTCKCRRRSRFDYTAIDEERSLLHKWEEEKQTQKNAERDAVLLNCYYYLKDSDMYSFVNHMPDMGSRLNKNWFLVRNSKSKRNDLLTMLEWSPQCILPCTKQTRKTLTDLFELLEHPYISTLLNVDVMLQHNLVVIIQPYRQAGSLKDILYGSRPSLSWLEKYEVKGKAMTLMQIKNYGRQILEALIYLHEKGLPPSTHIHSGNVFIVDGMCKFSGYEYTLLGYKARLQPFLKKLVKDNPDTAEIVAFGHLLFEMAAGYELNSPEPGAEQLVSCRSSPVVEVLNFIFFNESGSYPYLEEIARHEFFKDADVSHLKGIRRKSQAKFSANIKSMLKLYKKEGDSSQSRRRKVSRRRSRAESASTAPKKERKASRSKSKRYSVDSALPNVTYKSTNSAPYPPPSFGSPPPPPPPAVPQTITEHARQPRPGATKDRGALLSSICQGAKLKKTATNDRSAPRV